MKVLLKDYGKMYQIGDRQLQGGQLHELTASEVKKHSDIILTEIKEEKKTKVYTEKELFDRNKDQQVKILEKLGIKPASREADRVKQILEAQK